MKQIELQKISQQFKKEADLLLKKTGLIKSLGEHGDVFIRGSYELDLMMDGDIDIYVVNSKLDKKLAIKAFNELVMKNDFRGYLFYDFVTRRKKGFPCGYYLGAKTKSKDKKWNVDIWFMKKMDNVSDGFIKKVVAGLDEKKRAKILELKNMVKTSKLEIPSFVIYNAVIDAKADNIKQLVEFASK